MGCPGQVQTKTRSKIQPSQCRREFTGRRPPAGGHHQRNARRKAARSSRSVACIIAHVAPNDGATRGVHVARQPCNSSHERAPIMAHRLLSTAQRFARGRWTRPAITMRNQCAGAAAVDSSIRPRPEARLLRQPALEGLTRSTRMDSPRKTDRSKSDQLSAAAAAVKADGGGGF
ncbi:hypothetical protein F511_23968 [Dorcoceras hygrometricum]|uniref:Uncharacterized protein n=1 Tax=Dorcoceras hygrometricum TaxID=472368 RepID=A0A2Z7APX7_9LAMI|nr:hypothetical protein F511_23968 [Dorcoceras hygrometricum]